MCIFERNMNILLRCLLLGGLAFADLQYYLDMPVKGQLVEQAGTTCPCGWVNRGRIVNGEETEKNEYPMIISLELTKGQEAICGGTIITPWHVLTAAHCTYNINPEDIAILTEAHNLVASSKDPRIAVASIINHERYHPTTLKNDIAILVTAEKMRFSQLVGPACLPPKRLNLAGHQIRALGWGATSFLGESSNTLLQADLTVTSSDECVTRWWLSGVKPMPQPETNLCTFDQTRDTCQGDSGGPLLWLDPKTNSYTIAALVSFGERCAGNLPAVNTDVGAYLDWINNVTSTTKPEVQTCTRV